MVIKMENLKLQNIKRSSQIERNTNETKIKLSFTVLSDRESGHFTGSCGIGFMDHMLSAFCTHGHFSIGLEMTGDLKVDCHHSIEDLGIVLGNAFLNATADRSIINRFGSAYVPMDESLSRCVIDISSRPYLVFNAKFDNQYIGTLECSMLHEFFYAFASNAKITLHIENLYGNNDHHKAESIFKAFARALCDASCLRDGAVLSTKGTLDL